MKNLTMLVLLFSCACSSASKDADPTHAAVSSFLKKTLDDPSSYEPGRFSKVVPFFRSDSANMAAVALFKSNIRTEREKGYALADRYGKDTTKIGDRVIHTFRAKNKMGALVLDSANFLVHKNGNVLVL